MLKVLVCCYHGTLLWITFTVMFGIGSNTKLFIWNTILISKVLNLYIAPKLKRSSLLHVIFFLKKKLVWGIKRESKERESPKVRVLGFKNAYRLERVSHIRLEKKIEIKKKKIKCWCGKLWELRGFGFILIYWYID